MKFELIRNRLIGIPFINISAARQLYDLIIREKMTKILELGIAHGTATCYMAAALEELGGGQIDSVDLRDSEKRFDPTPEEQLNKTGLSKFVKIHRMQTGYNWFLHDQLRKQSDENKCVPSYDLCIIDGPKNWTVDGFAFFLADKLLRESGWIIFDDYSWTYAAAENRRRSTDGIQHHSLSNPEKTTPHIREIFELLVMQHSNYGEFHIFPTEDWAMARKCQTGLKQYSLVYLNPRKDLAASIRHAIMLALRSFYFRRLRKSRKTQRRDRIPETVN